MYLGFMSRLPIEHPNVYEEFTERYSNAVVADMKLKQKIKRSQKSLVGIIEQYGQIYFILEWEVVYHEILVIRNTLQNLTRS